MLMDQFKRPLMLQDNELYPQRVNRQKRVLDIEFSFSDQGSSRGGGERGGFRGGRGERGGRGGGRGRDNRGELSRNT